MNHRFPSTVPSAFAVWGGFVWLFILVTSLAMMQTTFCKPTSSLESSSMPLTFHHLAKRSFFDIECKGVYDKSIFARLDRICEDCYNLFREPELHSLCRRNCFTTDYFKGCLDVLQLQDEMEQFQLMIKHLHGAEPGV
ncbi:ion transport peptide-like isoform X1 [Agrilus planipennis]|uniref:Ion transport peptide-like isoform X1 n=1 Tax=Agrilus planipennis TaxID=224129 RepID=A0A1W4X3Y8_AGRPL|nr:ion transport peptide-like isoform X1 [Agrilus planipennis]